MLRRFTQLMAISGLAAAGLAGGDAAEACDRYVRVAVPRTTVVYYRPPVVEVQAARPVVTLEAAATPVKVEMPSLSSGATITVFGKYFGPAAGEALVQHGPVKMTCKIVNWQNDRVTLTLPEVEIDDSIHADLHLILPSGTPAKSMAFRFDNGPGVVVNRLGRGIVVSAQPEADTLSR